jgi:hypothetical protein
VADRGPHRRPQAALAFEIACARLNGLPSSQTVVRGRLGSPLDQEHCEHAIRHYLGAQCGDFKLQRSAKRRLQGAALDCGYWSIAPVVRTADLPPKKWPSFFDRGAVHEHIRAAVIGLNESIALCRVEPLHRSSRHLGRLPYPIGPKDNLMPIWKTSKTRGEPAGPEYGLVPTFLPNIRELTRF